MPDAPTVVPANPLFSANKLKLGIFGFNSTSSPHSQYPGRFVADWPRSVEIARFADEARLEAIVCFSNWRGPVVGDAKHISSVEFESFSWSSAIAALTTHPAIVVTFHAPFTHPTMVAKVTATIDHISGGRAALNIVAGSSVLAFGMFGLELEDPVARYDHTEEFVTLLRRIWDETEEFDFDGRFYTARKVVSLPKPLQKPYPPLMNAGASERGRRFAGEHADIAFTHLRGSMDDIAAHIAAYRKLAKDEFGRDIQVWTHSYLVVGDSETDAEAFARTYSEDYGDQRWVKAWHTAIAEGAPTLRPEQEIHMLGRWARGGGIGLVGSPEGVASTLREYSDAGLDGVLLTSIAPEQMFGRFRDEVMPLLVQAGLREG